MSMFIVSDDCFNDVANLIVKLHPYMELEDIVFKLVDLNVTVWNNKYNENVNVIDTFNNIKIVDYSNYRYKDKSGVIRFKDKYFNVQITQLVESLACYNYQISEPACINDLNNKFTYSFIKELIDNPLISEIIDYINYNNLNEFVKNGLCKVKGVDYR